MKRGIAFLFATVMSVLFCFISCKKEEADPFLEISCSEFSVNENGDTLTLNVTSNISWNVVSNADWVVLENNSNDGNGSVIIKVSANISSSAREATLTIYGESLKKEFVIKQSEAKVNDADHGDSGNENNNNGNNTNNGEGDEGGNNTEEGNPDTPQYTYFSGSWSPSNGGMVKGFGMYLVGEIAKLEASAAPGYVFSQWSDGETNNPREVVVSFNMSMSAIFVKESSEPSTVTIVDGKLPGRFSVSDTKKVSFSMGNLQYQASTNTWRFARTQYEIVGEDNSNISASYSGWVDLFGWATSGYEGQSPYMNSTLWEDYGKNYDHITNTNYDWGIFNAISNGGNHAGQWHTLTNDEWHHLLFTRANASKLRGQATVNGITGYILLPDEWNFSNGIAFTASPGDFTTNIYTLTGWDKMEAAGAVFLPCAGYRSGVTINSIGLVGEYWSSTHNTHYWESARGFLFEEYYATGGDYYINSGLSVRLVAE